MLENLFLCSAIFHSFTGCNSTASFYGKSKIFWYKLWMKQINELEDITSASIQLGWLPSTEAFEENLVLAYYNLKDKNLK